jgi:hypothetical protein
MIPTVLYLELAEVNMGLLYINYVSTSYNVCFSPSALLKSSHICSCKIALYVGELGWITGGAPDCSLQSRDRIWL